MRYFKAWSMGLKKAPGIYFSSAINGCYRYFELLSIRNRTGGDYKPKIYYEFKTAEKFYDIYGGEAFYTQYGVKRDDFENLNIAHGQKTEVFRKLIEKSNNKLANTPVTNLFFSIGGNFWIAVFFCAWLIKKKKYDLLLGLSIVWLSIPVCCLSPVNGNMRYALPIMFFMPFAWGIIFANDCAE